MVNVLENLELLTIGEISKRSPKLNQFTSPYGSMRKNKPLMPEWQRTIAREIYKAQQTQ